MRRWIWMALAAALPLWADQTAEEVKQIVAKMEALQRVTISPEADFKLYDPFRRAAPLIEKAKPVKKIKIPVRIPRLMAVMNDRALIDGRWLRVGDRIGGYRLIAVSSSGAWLSKRGMRRFLPIKKRRSLLKVKDRNE